VEVLPEESHLDLLGEICLEVQMIVLVMPPVVGEAIILDQTPEEWTRDLGAILEVNLGEEKEMPQGVVHPRVEKLVMRV